MKKALVLFGLLPWLALAWFDRTILEGVDYGTTSGRTYQNEFFAFELEVPRGWHSFSRPGIKSAIRPFEQSACIGLMAPVSHTGTKTRFAVFAETLSEKEREAVPDAGGYLPYAAKRIQDNEPDARIIKGPEVDLSGTVFHTLLIELPDGRKQRQYIARINNHMLIFSGTHRTESGKEQINEIIQSIRFTATNGPQ